MEIKLSSADAYGCPQFLQGGGGEKLKRWMWASAPRLQLDFYFYSTVPRKKKKKKLVLSSGQQIICICNGAPRLQNTEFSVQDIKGSRARSRREDKSRIA